MTNRATRITALRQQLQSLDAQRSSIAAQLAALLEASTANGAASAGPVMSESEKLALFRRLFSGRQDVFALRWENRKNGRTGYSPACSNEWVDGVCAKPKIKCGACPNQAFIPLSDAVLRQHLRGTKGNGKSTDYVAGIYPLLQDDHCWFLAADFDGEHWSLDALAYLETCRARAVPAALERSRSGQGGHVWIFFDEPIPALVGCNIHLCIV